MTSTDISDISQHIPALITPGPESLGLRTKVAGSRPAVVTFSKALKITYFLSVVLE